MIGKLTMSGTVTSTFEEFCRVLTLVIPGKDILKIKHRIVGEEISYYDSEFELYIFSLGHKDLFDNDNDNYQVDFSFEGELKKGESFIESLASVLKYNSHPYVFEYEIFGPDRISLEEEKILKYPKFIPG